jgi:peptidoglycan/LPS O-acetylase OafA/YrhL
VNDSKQPAHRARIRPENPAVGGPEPEHPRKLDWLDRLRSAGATDNLPYLDGIRALAVLGVFIRHAWGVSGSPALRVPLPGTGVFTLAPFVMMLSSGVDLFFVLSGFLLARKFLRADFNQRAPPRIGRYWLQRLLRIGPPYWLVLALVVFIFTPTLIPESAVYSWNGAWVFCAHLLFAQTLFLPAFGSYLIETPFWTLTIEMIFYASLPLLVRAFVRRRVWIALPASCLISLGWLWASRYSLGPLVGFLGRHSLWPFPEWMIRFFLSRTFLSHLFDFALGLTVANVISRREAGWRITPTFGRLTAPSSGILYFIVGSAWLLYFMTAQGRASLAHSWFDPAQIMAIESGSSRSYYFLEEVCISPGYALLLLGVTLGPKALRTLFSANWLCFFGVVGYSMYLIHMPILYHVSSLSWVSHASSTLERFAILLIFAGGAVAALSCGFFIAVEKPSMRAAKGIGRAPVRSSLPSE